MLFFSSLIILCSFNLAVSQKKKDFTCVPMDHCQCMFQNGLGINLNGLNVTFDTPGRLIIFHPCSNIYPSNTVFQNHTVAINYCKEGSSLCFYEMIDSNHSKMINLGRADSFEFQTSADGTKISLLSKYNFWTTTIHLQCSNLAQSDQGVLEFIKIENQNIELSLVSQKSCLTYEFSSVQFGGWKVVFIVICVLLLLYFLGGALLIRFLFGAETDGMIPHQSFWRTVKSHLKEIPSYCAGCCRSSHGYDEI